MLYNTNFCRPSDDGKTLVFAPVTIAPNPAAPTEEQYNAAGWFRKAIEPPTPPEGMMVSSITYVVEDNLVKASYTYAPLPPRVRVFSKLQLEDALFKEGLLDAVDAFIDAQVITNEYGQTMPLRRKYDTANDFRDDNIYFSQFLAAVKSTLGISDEKAEEILAAGEVDG